jgi:hypothetical protein
MIQKAGTFYWPIVQHGSPRRPLLKEHLAPCVVDDGQTSSAGKFARAATGRNSLHANTGFGKPCRVLLASACTSSGPGPLFENASEQHVQAEFTAFLRTTSAFEEIGSGWKPGCPTWGNQSEDPDIVSTKPRSLCYLTNRIESRRFKMQKKKPGTWKLEPKTLIPQIQVSTSRILPNNPQAPHNGCALSEASRQGQKGNETRMGPRLIGSPRQREGLWLRGRLVERRDYPAQKGRTCISRGLKAERKD